MKRKWIALIGVIFLLCISLFGGEVTVANAQTTSEEGAEQTDELLEEKIDELIDSLDTKELQDYLDSLAQFQGVSLKDKLKSIITGDFSIDYSNLTQSILSLIWSEFIKLLPAFAVILAASLVSGVLNSAKVGFLQSNMSDIIHFVSYLAVGGVMLSCLLTVLSSGLGAIEGMKRQSELVYPLLLTLMAGSGGAVSVAVYRPAVAFFSSILVNVFTTVVFPGAILLIILSFVGNLSEEVKTERLSELIKGALKWVIGLSLGLFTLFLTVQGVTSAQYDGLSLRAAKYALTNSVPIVGSFLSGGLDLVLAGSALIKNALGSFSILALFSTLLQPLALFIVFQLFLRLCAAATDPMGGKISTFLSKTAGNCGYFIAGLLCVAFLYFLTLLLLVCSSGVIF